MGTVLNEQCSNHRMYSMRRIILTILTILNIKMITSDRIFAPEADDNPFCKTPKGEEGSCLIISACRPDDKHLYITKDGRTTQYLRDSACGFDGNSPKICCLTQVVANTERSAIPLIEE